MKKSAAKILYIEDDTPSRVLVKKVLENSKHSFQFYEAADGMEGLELAESVQPDLILIDIHLPDFTGVELATKLRSQSIFDQTVILALTGRSSKNVREISLIGGCDGYLTKPIDINGFPDQLVEFLEGKREQVDADTREQFRQEYQESLVDHLSVKIEQLQKYNELLNERSEKLRTYSHKLEILLDVINELQMCQSPEALTSALVENVCGRLKFDRCAVLEINSETMTLEVTGSYGFEMDGKPWPRVNYEAQVFRAMFADRQILFFPNLASVPDNDTRALLQQMGAQQFVFGVLGMSAERTSHISEDDNLQQLISSMIPTLHDQHELDAGIIREHLHEYLHSNLFNLSGYVFVDYQGANRRIAPYDIRILEMLMRTSSLLYQNLRFREQLKRLFVRAEKEAITDHLTGLFNYRYFSQQLTREHNRAFRHRSPFVLLMLDIDHFKSYNDTLGHQAGDLALQKVASLLLENTRRSDFVARYGGEEFAIICPELSREEGRFLAQKLCNIVADTSFAHEEKLPHEKVTISIGIAGFPDDTESLEELVRMADSALYTAKENGRNQVQLYEAVAPEEQ